MKYLLEAIESSPDIIIILGIISIYSTCLWFIAKGFENRDK